MSALAPWQVPRTPEEIAQRNEENRIRTENEAAELAASLARISATQIGEACKGPWKVGPLRRDDHGEFFYLVYDAAGNALVDVFVADNCETVSEALATARLIAAAPSLLAALKALQIQALQSDLNSPAHEWGWEALAMTSAAIVLAAPAPAGAA